MKPLLGAAFLSILMAMTAAAAPRAAGTGVAVVELFTSEGCSSCPPADDALIRLNALAAREGLPVYALEWHVDYWDYLGWKDPFDSHLATLRQESYARALASSLFTPEAVINGSVIASWAGDSAELERDVRSAGADPSPAGVQVQAMPGTAPSTLQVTVRTSRAPGGSQVLAALVEEGLGARPTAGENAGQALRHSSVVRSAVTLPAAGGEAVLPVPQGTDLARTSVIGLVQDRSMRILAATRTVVLAASGARLSGRVIDPAGRAVAGVTVQACSGTVCVPAVTDSTGSFHFEGLAAGAWSLVAGPGPRTVEVSLGAGQDLRLPAALVAAR